jgi:hypothetical protein
MVVRAPFLPLTGQGLEFAMEHGWEPLLGFGVGDLGYSEAGSGAVGKEHQGSWYTLWRGGNRLSFHLREKRDGQSSGGTWAELAEPRGRSLTSENADAAARLPAPTPKHILRCTRPSCARK